MKKTRMLFALLLVLAGLLCACAPKEEPEATVPATTAAETTVETTQAEPETEPEILFEDSGERDYESAEPNPNHTGNAPVPPATQPKATEPRPTQGTDGKHYSNIFGENETAERDI